MLRTQRLGTTAADWYDAEALLTTEERRVLGRLRTFLETEAKPLLAEYWERGEFPEQLAQPLIDLDLMEPDELTVDAPARGIFHGFRIFELARTDASLATWYTAQAGLFRTAIRVGASEEQQKEWMPKVIDFSLKGVFSLTEPEYGSDIAGGLSTTARFEPGPETEADGGSWVLDGAKRWIGGASTADVLCVFARDVADGQVKAFLVDRSRGRSNPGEDPRQDVAADDAERPHHPRRASGCRRPCACTT